MTISGRRGWMVLALTLPDVVIDRRSMMTERTEKALRSYEDSGARRFFISRELGAALFVFFMVTIVFTALMTAQLLQKAAEDHLGVYGDRAVLNTLPGIEGPAIEERGTLQVRGESCIHLKRKGTVLQVVSSTSYRRVDMPGRAADSVIAKTSRADGCTTATVALVLPPEVTPGVWIADGVERGLGELRSWSTDPFRVVARPPVNGP